MIIEKNRHMNELTKLFRSSEAVTAEELASFTDSSVRTVKNDMKYLNEELLTSEGCEIVSHKGKGYSIAIIDAEKSGWITTQINGIARFIWISIDY